MYDQIGTILHAINFMENHIQQQIMVGDVADAVGYSPFHFIRLFNQVVHHTPYDYLIRRRLTEAALEIAGSKHRLIDIAQDYVFANQETFSRMFHKMFHLSPSECRKKNGISPRLLYQVKTVEDLRFASQIESRAPSVVDLEDVHLFGLMTEITPGVFSSQSRWTGRQHELHEYCGMNPDTRLFEVLISTDCKWQKVYSFIGTEEKNLGAKPVTLTSIRIPGGTYARIMSGLNDHLPALRYLYSTWIPKAGLLAGLNMNIRQWDSVKENNAVLVPVQKPSC